MLRGPRVSDLHPQTMSCSGCSIRSSKVGLVMVIRSHMMLRMLQVLRVVLVVSRHLVVCDIAGAVLFRLCPPNAPICGPSDQVGLD